MTVNMYGPLSWRVLCSDPDVRYLSLFELENIGDLCRHVYVSKHQIPRQSPFLSVQTPLVDSRHTTTPRTIAETNCQSFTDIPTTHQVPTTCTLHKLVTCWGRVTLTVQTLHWYTSISSRLYSFSKSCHTQHLVSTCLQLTKSVSPYHPSPDLWKSVSSVEQSSVPKLTQWLWVSLGRNNICWCSLKLGVFLVSFGDPELWGIRWWVLHVIILNNVSLFIGWRIPLLSFDSYRYSTRQEASHRHVDTTIANAILKKSTRASFHQWTKDDWMFSHKHQSRLLWQLVSWHW